MNWKSTRREWTALAASTPLWASATSPALNALVEAADKTLTAGPFSVMDKKLTPPSGDKHDYMSVGPYWWPDPSKPGGLPYIRRDGEVNPEHDDDRTDRVSMGRMFSSSLTLALAYRETKDARYANHAARLIRTWFLDPATRMNPNLNFAQAIRGRVDGRGIGIIDTRAIAELLDAIAWLKPAWSVDDERNMQRWGADYLRWLADSPHGRDEADEANNHGTWYDVQFIALALYTGRKDLARKQVEQVKKRIASQIEPDGRQPLELARTKAFSYSLMNLRAFFDLAAYGDRLQVDLWRHRTTHGRSLRGALDFLAPYIDPAKQWPHAQLGGMSLNYRLELGALLRRAAIAYRETKYEQMLDLLPKEDWSRHRTQIQWPRPRT
jgi:hypothetical protein